MIHYFINILILILDGIVVTLLILNVKALNRRTESTNRMIEVIQEQTKVLQECNAAFQADAAEDKPHE